MDPATEEVGLAVDWVSLGSILIKTVDQAAFAALHATIKREGIFVLGEFNFPEKRPPDSSDVLRVLNFITKVYDYETGAAEPADGDRHPMDVARGPADLTEIFGWTEQTLPEFAATGVTASVLKPPSESGQTKRLQSCYVVIAALAKRAELDLAAPGVAVRVQEATVDLGVSLDHGTVKKLLGEVSAELSRRMHG